MESPTQGTPNPVKRSPKINDVAAALGMHKSTISLGLSGKGNVSQKTRERIVAVAREMGYQPNPLAQRLATSGANNMACLCAGTLDVGLTTEKILLLQKELTQIGMEAPIYTLPNIGDGQALGQVQAEQVRHLCRQQPKAIIFSVQSVSREVFGELERYQDEGGILVTYDFQVPISCPQVVFDREDNAYRTTRHLIDQGHRAIGFAMTSPRLPEGVLNNPQNARLGGFSRAMAEAGLEMRPDWVFEEAAYEAGGARLAADFLALKERPTAMCVVNDYMALAFMVEVMRAGLRVPEDVSIIGHDNQPIAVYCPVPLTAATQPREEIVRGVISLLNDRITDPLAVPRTVTVRGELVERQSVARRS